MSSTAQGPWQTGRAERGLSGPLPAGEGKGQTSFWVRSALGCTPGVSGLQPEGQICQPLGLWCDTASRGHGLAVHSCVTCGLFLPRAELSGRDRDQRACRAENLCPLALSGKSLGTGWYQGPAMRAPRDAAEGSGVGVGKEDSGVTPSGDAAPGAEELATGDAQAARPYKQEPGSPQPAPPPPPPPAPGLPAFLAAPGSASCPECGKASLKPAHLLRHRQSHSGEKPHACPECGKAFRRKEHLRRHRGTHPGGPGPALRPLPAREKPHACCECGKTFYWREHLVRHRKTHSGARPFACWECGKGFGRREHVLRHQRIHGRAAGAGGAAAPGPEGGGPFPPWPLG
ncbi:zinc finger protein 444 isoform X1 [Kogia breviceps]|uniref:zinc finger protein 444 isoform X1 n=1 Tax=Kogia breviceps TaxID=27615 RepID=UPI0034D2F853